MRQQLREFLRRHGQFLVNLLVFGFLGYGALYRAYHSWTAEKFDLVEAAFFTHNVVLLAIILLRREHIAIDRDFLHQGVAMIAFFSGIAFDDRPTVSSPLLLHLSAGVAILAMALGTIVLLNLGRSFGILISLRKVRTNGAYSIIRHPMYLTDIMWRLGFILRNPSVYNFALAVVSTAAYVWRALLEERFLSRFPEYRDYMARVRYRFIPGVF